MMGTSEAVRMRRAVDFGEHDVQHDDIGWPFAGGNQGRMTIGGSLDHKSFEAQTTAQITGNLGFVFDD
jgi:hypothetical protein